MSEPWEMTEQEVTDTFRNGRGWSIDSGAQAVAHAAALHARKETLKEIGEWLDTHPVIPWHEYCEFVAALKAGRKR